MTQYYVDSDNGLDTNAGTTTGAAFKTVNKFTEGARTAGDVCTIRRGRTATIDDGGLLDFTSDGTYADPIVCEADFDDSWLDFANSAQTYTAVFGSKTMTASATITGISAGDWIYNSTDGDDPREFSYEVDNVSGTTLTLFLPFKGSTGATKTLKVMPANPIWGATTAFAFDVNYFLDNFWKMQGIEFQSSNTISLFDMDRCNGVVFKDCILKASSSTELFDCGTIGIATVKIFKTRCFEYESVIDFKAGTSLNFNDCLFDGNSIAKYVDTTSAVGDVIFICCEFKGHITADISGNTLPYGGVIKSRNCIFGSTSEFDRISSTGGAFTLDLEDYDGTPGVSWQHNTRSSSNTVPLVQSDTTTLRTGGNNISLLITPSTQLGKSEAGRFEVFEYPIYATTASKTYTVYFKSNATTDWTANPTASELWLELEAWGHATNNFRKITKSTGTVDFTTNTNFDKTLAVTVAPAQAGVAYLRLYYGKTKETSKANKFYIDPKVVIT